VSTTRDTAGLAVGPAPRVAIRAYSTRCFATQSPQSRDAVSTLPPDHGGISCRGYAEDKEVITTTREVPTPGAVESAPRPRWALPLRARNALLTAHIVISVGLLGDSAGFLAVAIRAATTDNPAVALDSVSVLNMFSLVFGIPLSIGALLTGLALGLGTRWGVFRYPWVTAKLAIVISVMLVGGFIIGPAENAMLVGTDSAVTSLIAAAIYDVAALTLATGLSVFKPGRRIQRWMPGTV
jgi:hypothetical protein